MFGECCKDKKPRDFCEDCHLELAVFFIKNEVAVMRYLTKFDPTLYREMRSASFKL